MKAASTTGFLEVHSDPKVWEDYFTLHDDTGMLLCISHIARKFAGKHVMVTITELPEQWAFVQGEDPSKIGYTRERKKMAEESMAGGHK